MTVMNELFCAWITRTDFVRSEKSEYKEKRGKTVVC